MIPPHVRYKERLYLFAGPTLAHINPRAVSHLPLCWKGPLKSGDLEELLSKNSTPSEVIIVDGLLESNASTRIQEITLAIDEGWQFWGLASTGAMLAAQMRCPRMQGFGFIYQQFCLGEIDLDDISLIHTSEPPYIALSEPLIHQRLLIEHLKKLSWISQCEATAIQSHIKKSSLDQRTCSALFKLLLATNQMSPEMVRYALDLMPSFRVKAIDLICYIRCRFQ